MEGIAAISNLHNVFSTQFINAMLLTVVPFLWSTSKQNRPSMIASMVIAIGTALFVPVNILLAIMIASYLYMRSSTTLQQARQETKHASKERRAAAELLVQHFIKVSASTAILEQATKGGPVIRISAGKSLRRRFDQINRQQICSKFRHMLYSNLNSAEIDFPIPQEFSKLENNSKFVTFAPEGNMVTTNVQLYELGSTLILTRFDEPYISSEELERSVAYSMNHNMRIMAERLDGFFEQVAASLMEGQSLYAQANLGRKATRVVFEMLEHFSDVKDALAGLASHRVAQFNSSEMVQHVAGQVAGPMFHLPPHTVHRQLFGMTEVLDDILLSLMNIANEHNREEQKSLELQVQQMPGSGILAVMLATISLGHPRGSAIPLSKSHSAMLQHIPFDVFESELGESWVKLFYTQVRFDLAQIRINLLGGQISTGSDAIQLAVPVSTEELSSWELALVGGSESSLPSIKQDCSKQPVCKVIDMEEVYNHCEARNEYRQYQSLTPPTVSKPERRTSQGTLQTEPIITFSEYMNDDLDIDLDESSDLVTLPMFKTWSGKEKFEVTRGLAPIRKRYRSICKNRPSISEEKTPRLIDQHLPLICINLDTISASMFSRYFDVTRISFQDLIQRRWTKHEGSLSYILYKFKSREEGNCVIRFVDGESSCRLIGLYQSGAFPGKTGLGIAEPLTLEKIEGLAKQVLCNK